MSLIPKNDIYNNKWTNKLIHLLILINNKGEVLNCNMDDVYMINIKYF